MELLLDLRLSGDVHINRLCRLCLSVSEESKVVPIFQIADPGVVSLQKRIAECFQLNVNENDGLPANICIKCASKVTEWFELLETARLSERSLRTLLLSQPQEVFDVKSENFSDGADLDWNEETNDDDDIPLSQFLKSCGLDKPVVDKKRNRCSNEERKSKPRGRTLKAKPFCTDCDLKFTKLRELFDHQKEAHGLLEDEAKEVATIDNNKFVIYRCHICKEEFNGRSGLRVHCKETHDLKVIYPYGCSHCDRQFPSWNLLVVHERQHTGEKPYSCDLCGKENFISYASLRRHKLMHMKAYSCKQCGRDFNCDSALQAHIRCKHTNEKPFLCNICGRSFSLATILKAHMTSHSSERKFKCEICGFRSKTSGNHHRHKSRHNQGGPKTFHCGTCGKSFESKLKLSSHMIIHKPTTHACKVCGKGFLFKNKLERHILLVHARERPYPCALCGRKLASKFGLGIHLKTHSKQGQGQGQVGVGGEEGRERDERPQMETPVQLIPHHAGQVKMIIGDNCNL